MLYSTKREDLLGGIVNVLTGGRAKKVTISERAKTGMTEYDPRTGGVRRIVMPKEENLPEGCTLSAARGLLDHESGHAIYTEMDFKDPLSGLLHTIWNILEDPRIEALMMARFEGSVENITALSDLGYDLQKKAFEMDLAPLAMALNGISLVAYRRDPRDLIAGKPHAEEVLTFLDHARPHIEAALASEDTAGVNRAAREILELLKDATKHQPKPKPEKADRSAPKERGEDGDGAEDAQAQEGPESDPGEAEPSEGGKEKGEKESRADGATEPPKGQPEEGSSESKPSPSTPEDDSRKAPEASGNPDDLGEPMDDCPDSEPWESSVLSEATKDAEESGHSPAFRTPAEAVLDAMSEAIEQAVKELEQAEALELLKAQKSGLLCPIGTHPRDWRIHEMEHKLETNSLLVTEHHRTVQAMKPVSMGIRHSLRNVLLAEGRTRIRTERESGELNPRALFHVAQGTSKAVFRTITKGKSKKTHVTLLVDCSGSMGGTKEFEARRAAVALNEALSGLPGVTTEILGFSWGYFGDGSGFGCLHYIAKALRERSAAGAMALEAGGGNCDGSAVRWAARRALSVYADRRVLMVLSDGAPTDGPSPDADLRAAVDAAERHHVETVGIGILDRSVTRYYPKNVVIYDANNLTGTVLQMLAGLLKPQAVIKTLGKARKVS